MSRVLKNGIIAAMMLLLAAPAYAICPLCTVAVAAGVGIFRQWGINDMITGLWYGAMIMSSLLWWLDWRARKGKNPSKLLTGLVFYGLFILPLFKIPIIGFELIGTPGNTLLGIDKILLGIILGSLVFIASVKADKLLRKVNENAVAFQYQKVAVPLAFMLVVSIMLHFINHIVRWRL
jgi:hypothetical protein